MRIVRAKIRNYKSIRECEVELQPVTVLLGANGHGKSNFLQALGYFFSTSTKLTSSDVCRAITKSDTEVLVELTFSNLTEQEQTTFKQYVLDDSITVRKLTQVRHNEDGVEIGETKYGGLQRVPRVSGLNPSEAGNYLSRDKITKLSEKGIDLNPYLPESGRLTKDMIIIAQRDYIKNAAESIEYEEQWIEPFMGEQRIAAGIIGDFLLVPAVKDVSDETKIQKETVFGKLLNRAIALMTSEYPEYAAVREGLGKLVELFNASDRETSRERPPQIVELENTLALSLTDWGVTVVNIKVTPPEVDRLLQLGTTIEIDDGVLTSPADKGHGLQRALLFSLTRAWAEIVRADREKAFKAGGDGTTRRAPATSLFYAIEEPELYLHPHAQRTMFSNLRALAEEQDTQVIFSTHSSFFVDLNDHRSILILRKDTIEEGTMPFQVTGELWGGVANEQEEKRAAFKAAYFFNPDRSEVFFARKVVLCEGQSEKVCLRYLAETSLNLDVSAISWIDTGGKHNIPLYMDVLGAFGIPYIAVHDEDPITEPDTTSERYKEQARTFALNNLIASKAADHGQAAQMISPDFDECLGTSINQIRRLGKPLANFERICKQEFSLPPEIQALCQQIAS